jgi:hypothetical protein
MTQGLFGSLTPTWTGLSPAPAWPAFGPSFSGVESAPGQMSGIGPGYTNTGLPPIATGNITTPFLVPGGVPAATVIAALLVRRGQPHGPASEQDVEELLYDAIEMMMPNAGEVEVRCESGRLSLTGAVPNKRVKHDIGELAWAVPGINDVNNTLNIQSRRRARGFTREPETQSAGPSRKQA